MKIDSIEKKLFMLHKIVGSIFVVGVKTSITRICNYIFINTLLKKKKLYQYSSSFRRLGEILRRNSHFNFLLPNKNHTTPIKKCV